MIPRIWTLIKIEFYKFLRQRLFYISLFLVLAVVVLSAISEKIAPSAAEAVNGFGPLISASINGFRLVTFLILVIGALLFASETTFGTLRTVLIAPVRRSEIVVAKAIALIILALFFALMVETVSFGLAWSLYGFRHIADPTFAEIIHLSRSDMLIYLAFSFIHILLPLAAAGLMGLFISTLVENSGVAVAVSIIIYLVLDFFMAGFFDTLSSFLFNYYQGYFIGTVKDISEGIMQEIWKFRAIGRFFGIGQIEEGLIDPARQASVIKSILIPLAYSVIFIIASIIAVNRKNA